MAGCLCRSKGGLGLGLINLGGGVWGRFSQVDSRSQGRAHGPPVDACFCLFSLDLATGLGRRNNLDAVACLAVIGKEVCARSSHAIALCVGGSARPLLLRRAHTQQHALLVEASRGLDCLDRCIYILGMPIPKCRHRPHSDAFGCAYLVGSWDLGIVQPIRSRPKAKQSSFDDDDATAMCALTDQQINTRTHKPNQGGGDGDGAGPLHGGVQPPQAHHAAAGGASGCV